MYNNDIATSILSINDRHPLNDSFGSHIELVQNAYNTCIVCNAPVRPGCHKWHSPAQKATSRMHIIKDASWLAIKGINIVKLTFSFI